MQKSEMTRAGLSEKRAKRSKKKQKRASFFHSFLKHHWPKVIIKQTA
jgi:hypothetical protein